jgi:capsule polysaccharide export protein KpsE/RkpR
MKLTPAEVETELADITAKLNRWESQAIDVDDRSKIQELRNRIAAIKKHLGIDKKISA